MFELLNLTGKRVTPNLSYDQFSTNKPLYCFPLTASDYLDSESLPLIRDGIYKIKVRTLFL